MHIVRALGASLLRGGERDSQIRRVPHRIENSFRFESDIALTSDACAQGDSAAAARDLASCRTSVAAHAIPGLPHDDEMADAPADPDALARRVERALASVPADCSLLDVHLLLPRCAPPHGRNG